MNPLQQKAKAGVITAAYLNFRISEGKKKTKRHFGCKYSHLEDFCDIS